MVRVGLVGVGFMGWIHYLAYQRLAAAGGSEGDAAVKFAAVCSRSEKRLAGDWTGIQGNFGPPGRQIDLAGVSKYRSLEDLLQDPEIDLVDLCLPPDLHADAAVKAFQAGKHVLVEKPIALRPEEAERMVAAAKAAGKMLLVAHVLPYFPEYRYALEAIRSGRFGKFQGGIFKRCISEPTWIPDFFDANKTGGPVVDLHIHDAHFIQLAAGAPLEVASRGRLRGDVVEWITSQFTFADPAVQVLAISGVRPQQGRPFTHGFEIHLEKATLLYESAVLAGQSEGTGIPLTVLGPDGLAERPALGDGDPILAFALELQDAANAVAEGRPNPTLDGGIARDALVLCHRQTASVQSGKPVAV